MENGWRSMGPQPGMFTVRCSHHYMTHLSDALRLAVLYKYGGLYMDTDIWPLKPLGTMMEEIPNFVARAPGGMISNAVIKVHKAKEPLVWDMMQTCRKQYSRGDYATMMHSTRQVVKDHCNQARKVKMESVSNEVGLIETCGKNSDTLWKVFG